MICYKLEVFRTKENRTSLQAAVKWKFLINALRLMGKNAIKRCPGHTSNGCPGLNIEFDTLNGLHKRKCIFLAFFLPSQTGFCFSLFMSSLFVVQSQFLPCIGFRPLSCKPSQLENKNKLCSLTCGGLFWAVLGVFKNPVENLDTSPITVRHCSWLRV